MTHYTEDSTTLEIELTDKQINRTYTIFLYICAKLSKDMCEIKVKLA